MPLIVWILIGLWGGFIAAITFIKFIVWLSPWQWAWWGWPWWPWRWPWWRWRWWPWWWPWWQWAWWPWWWPWGWLWWWWIIPLAFLIIVIPLGFFEWFDVWLLLIIAILLFLLLVLIIFLLIFFGWWLWPWWPWRWPWWRWAWWPWWWWKWRFWPWWWPWWRWAWWPWWWWKWWFWPWWFWPWWKCFWWIVFKIIFWAVLINFILCKIGDGDGEERPPTVPTEPEIEATATPVITPSPVVEPTPTPSPAPIATEVPIVTEAPSVPTGRTTECGGDTVTYNGPTQARTGSAFGFQLTVTDTNVEGQQIFATLGSNPNGPTATHTDGILGPGGTVQLFLQVQEPAGPSILWIGWNRQGCQMIPDFQVLP